MEINLKNFAPGVHVRAPRPKLDSVGAAMSLTPADVRAEITPEDKEHPNDHRPQWPNKFSDARNYLFYELEQSNPLTRIPGLRRLIRQLGLYPPAALMRYSVLLNVLNKHQALLDETKYAKLYPDSAAEN